MGKSIRQSKKNTKSMAIRSEHFASWDMYAGLHTINGCIETCLIMNQKTNELLMKSKRFT